MSIRFRILVIIYLYMKEFKEVIKELMDEKNISQAQLAKQIHTTQGTVSKWLNGKQDPRYTQLQSICIKFGVSSDFLLGIDE